MKVLIVDDEKLILEELCDVLAKALPFAEQYVFSDSDAALSFAQTRKIDIAFLDISMVGTDGLTMARQLQRLNPVINIIFCTGYSEYALDAHDLYCSGYLLKPVTMEKVVKALSNLRYEPEEADEKIEIRCFGDFEVYHHGLPVHFKYSKTKEMLAYLVDRRGKDCHVRDIARELFGEDSKKKSYFSNIRRDLIAFTAFIGQEDILRHNYGILGIERDKVNCDYFDFLDGKNQDYNGEYMNRYAFAEQTREDLKTIADEGKKTLYAVQAMQDYFAAEPGKY